jgi:hypothetical protein
MGKLPAVFVEVEAFKVLFGGKVDEVNFIGVFQYDVQ